MRILARAALAFSAAVFAANYILPLSWAPPLAVALAILGALVAALRRRWLRGVVVMLIAAACGLGLFDFHAQRTTVAAEGLDGEIRQITARVLEYPQDYGDYSRARVRLSGEDLPALEAVLYDYEHWIRDAEPGQQLRFIGKLKAADRRYGESYDAYKAKDIYLTLTAQTPVLLLERPFDLRTLPVRLHHALLEQTESLFPEDMRAYMQALMLGDKTALYERPAERIALSRAGFMHVVAVSGMHIAYLVTALQLLLGRGRRSALVCILLLWFFVLTSGASPSAVRAGIMQSFLLLAPIAGRENDPLTSLSAALALILLKNPYAAVSVSLQLSFAAMAGLMCFTDRLDGLLTERLPQNRLGQVLRGPAHVIAVSLSSMVFTMPLMALHFGYAAILSPFTGVLALWTVPISFCGGYLACGLGALLPMLGRAAAWLIAWPGRLLLLTARLSAAIPFALIYLREGLALLWLIFCYAAFILCALSRLDRRLKLLLPLGLSAVSLALALTVTRTGYERLPGVLTVLDVGQGQCVTAYAGKETVVLDCGGLWSLDNAGETAGAYLLSCGRREVDLLFLSHLHADHANGVPLLLEMLPVRQIVMPPPADEDAEMLREISEAAARRGTQILYLRDDLELRLGAMSLSLYAPVLGGDANERCATAKLSFGSYDALFTGDASAQAERALLAAHELRELELLLVGHHGSDDASCAELLGAIGADDAVISCGYNHYGHPGAKTLERLAEYGYTVYRTDKDGNVTIRIGREYGETNGEKR